MSTNRVYYYGIRLREFYGGKVDPSPIPFIRRKKPTDLEPPRVIANTTVIEIHESSEPYAEVEALATKLCHSYSSQEYLRNSVRSTKTRVYYYGIRLEDTPPQPRPFVVKKKCGENQKPPEALVLYESTKPPGELKELARDLLGEYKKSSLQRILEERIPQEQELPSPGDVQVGDVVIHNDHEGNHFAIILEIPDEVSAWALFLSSKVWGKVSRKATKDELALVGFVSTNGTYLNLAYRHILDFYRHGISFPEHRTQKLRQEFLQNLTSEKS
jgi:hypothetical protein